MNGTMLDTTPALLRDKQGDGNGGSLLRRLANEMVRRSVPTNQPLGIDRWWLGGGGVARLFRHLARTFVNRQVGGGIRRGINR